MPKELPIDCSLSGAVATSETRSYLVEGWLRPSVTEARNTMARWYADHRVDDLTARMRRAYSVARRVPAERSNHQSQAM